MSVEKIILQNLIFNKDYATKVLPFLKTEYFHNYEEDKVFSIAKDYIEEYKELPSKDALRVKLDQDETVIEDSFNETMKLIDELSDEPEQLAWLLDETEKFCQEKAIYNGIQKSVLILKGDEKKLRKEAIPDILKEALSVSFDTNIGHDYLEDAEERFDFYQSEDEKLACDLEMMNRITEGGFPRKSLNVFLAGTHVGKTLCMCHFASSYLESGHNVLYITLEMGEKKGIAKRIDANLLNFPMNEIEGSTKENFMGRVGKVKGKTRGKLMIKEYPIASVGASHFRYLINEYELKKGFKPDIVFIDYLNLCLSMRFSNRSAQKHEHVQSVAEELRGLAQEKDLVMFSATQLNRTGFSNSDFDMDDIAESFGVSMTVDFMVGLINSDELQALEQIMVKQLKNRHGDVTKNKKFVIGIDRPKMRLYDVEQQAEIADKPVMDNTDYGSRRKEDESMDYMTKKAGRKDFSKLFK